VKSVAGALTADFLGVGGTVFVFVGIERLVRSVGVAIARAGLTGMDADYERQAT